jgi:hypothetical protein
VPEVRASLSLEFLKDLVYNIYMPIAIKELFKVVSFFLFGITTSLY